MHDVRDGFLAAALRAARDENRWVLLESWNDWGEQTQIAPGFHFDRIVEHQDYFSPLRRIAEHKGLADIQFPFPDPEVLDAPLRQYCRDKQWENSPGLGRPDGVRLKGTIGLGQGADACTNGVKFSVSYLDSGGVWRLHWSRSKNYDGTLAAFDIDLTSILDWPIVFGVEADGSPTCDWVHLVDFHLDWYGHRKDLNTAAAGASLSWHSGRGAVAIGNRTRPETDRI